jgi:RsiW-degrading membrane proteinase PrsW (M82 family)
LISGNSLTNSRPQPGGRSPSPFPSPSALLPVHRWAREPALRSWPVLLLIALVCVPPIAVVLLNQPTTMHLDDAAWIYAYYFAIAWLLLLGVIVRPQHVTRSMLATVAVVGVVTQVPLALALETSLHSNNGNLFASIFTIGVPEEMAKAIPVLVVAWLWRWSWSSQTPRDYLFLGAVSGLVFGAVEAERYFTSVSSLSGTVNGAFLQQLTISYVWRFVTDPIGHACWAGITGYFIGLAITGPSRRYALAFVGIGLAALLHGLNDWSPVNGHATWIVVTLVSVLLFLGYAKAGVRIPGQAQEPALAAAAVAQPTAARARERATAPRPGPPVPGNAWWQAQPGSPRRQTATRPWWEQ